MEQAARDQLGSEAGFWRCEAVGASGPASGAVLLGEPLAGSSARGISPFAEMMSAAGMSLLTQGQTYRLNVQRP